MKQVKTVKQRLTNARIIGLSVMLAAMVLSVAITAAPVMAAADLSDSLTQFITDNFASPDLRNDVLESAREAVDAGASDGEIMQAITDSIASDASGDSVDEVLESLAGSGDDSEIESSDDSGIDDDENDADEGDHDDGDDGGSGDEGGESD